MKWFIYLLIALDATVREVWQATVLSAESTPFVSSTITAIERVCVIEGDGNGRGNGGGVYGV